MEIGVFTGYSALCLAEGLPSDGKLTALDVSKEWTDVAKKYWKEAGVDSKIDLRLGPGLQYLDKMISDKKEVGTFDFAYVDADKPNYPNYYDRLVTLIRSGGFIMFDNVLWAGNVQHEHHRKNDEKTRCLFETNQKALNDSRVEAHTINIGDGFMVVKKK